MNLLHRWYCSSSRWADIVHGRMMPWILGDLDLGEDVLEIGPGPGLTTDWLRARVGRLTSIEIDARLSGALKDRLQGTNVNVVQGDGTAMPFPDGSFSAATSFTMLHHVPSPELQDRLLAETCRVLRAGAVFAGSDSYRGLFWKVNHLFDTGVPVPPETFGERLEATGFTDVSVDAQKGFFRFEARKPGG